MSSTNRTAVRRIRPSGDTTLEAWPYNGELEYYTTRTNNARIQGGNLVIEADQESYGWRNYTSARLKTQDQMVMGIWPHGSTHQDPARTGNLARVLDAGHKL